jgi:hypothetical protein
VSISVWAQWIAMLLRHSSSPNPSSIETLIHSHQTYFYFRDWERLSPCPKGIFPETKHATPHARPLTAIPSPQQHHINIRILPTTSLPFPAINQNLNSKCVNRPTFQILNPLTAPPSSDWPVPGTFMRPRRSRDPCP